MVIVVLFRKGTGTVRHRPDRRRDPVALYLSGKALSAVALQKPAASALPLTLHFR